MRIYFAWNINVFIVDPRIQSSSVELDDWPLSRVFLKNEKEYPWLILVPRKIDLLEIHQLSRSERHLLTEEINQLSLIISHFFKPKKLNIGALGNVVAQLHIHIVGRNEQDKLWPQGIWQSAFNTTPYGDEDLQALLPRLSVLVREAGLMLQEHCL